MSNTLKKLMQRAEKPYSVTVEIRVSDNTMGEVEIGIMAWNKSLAMKRATKKVQESAVAIALSAHLVKR